MSPAFPAVLAGAGQGGLCPPAVGALALAVAVGTAALMWLRPAPRPLWIGLSAVSTTLLLVLPPLAVANFDLLLAIFLLVAAAVGVYVFRHRDIFVRELGELAAGRDSPHARRLRRLPRLAYLRYFLLGATVYAVTQVIGRVLVDRASSAPISSTRYGSPRTCGTASSTNRSSCGPR